MGKVAYASGYKRRFFSQNLDAESSYCPLFVWILLYLYMLPETEAPTGEHKRISHEIMLTIAE